MAAASAVADPDYKAPRLQLSLADFELLRRIGDGSFSHVVLARHRATGKEYALKVVDKQYILRHKVVDYIRNERIILDMLQYDGIAKLYFTFQDAFSLYLGLEYCPNGELYDQVRLRGRLEEPIAAFYTAEVVLMLEYLRSKALVHRDLKPENLLLDGDGHLKLIDFGSAKQLRADEAVPVLRGVIGGGAAVDGAVGAEDGVKGDEEAPDGEASSAGSTGTAEFDTDAADAAELAVEPSRSSSEGEDAADGPAAGGAAGGLRRGGSVEPSKRTVSLVGTADYVSPEVLHSHPISCATDLWALGCVLYQMLVGRSPFKSPSEYLTFQKIVEADYELPAHLSEDAEDLIGRLLRLEPSERIGALDMAELKAHPFFTGIDWEGLRAGPAPEFVAEMEPAPSSASSFDWELQSLASALPAANSGADPLELEDAPSWR